MADSSTSFAAHPVKIGTESGYLVSGFLTKDQLAELRKLLTRGTKTGQAPSKVWRGQYYNLAHAMVNGIEEAIGAP